MSGASRWTVALFCLFFAVMTLSIPLTMPESGVTVSKSMFVVVPLVLIAVACFPGRFQKAAARLIAAGVFFGCCAYVISQIGKPMPDLSKYRRSDTNIVNALIAMVIFGIPAAYIAATGQFPKWTILHDRLHGHGSQTGVSRKE